MREGNFCYSYESETYDDDWNNMKLYISKINFVFVEEVWWCEEDYTANYHCGLRCGKEFKI